MRRETANFLMLIFWKDRRTLKKKSSHINSRKVLRRIMKISRSSASTGRSVKDEAVEGLQERLSLKPMVGDLNIGIIEDARYDDCASAEPFAENVGGTAGGAVILFLRRIVRICCRLNPFPVVLCGVWTMTGHRLTAEPDEIEKQAACAGEMLLAGNSFYSFAGIMDADGEGKRDGLQFLDRARGMVQGEYFCPQLQRCRKRALSEDSRMTAGYRRQTPENAIMRVVTLIEEARNDLLRNVNSGYTLKNLVLKIQQGS